QVGELPLEVGQALRQPVALGAQRLGRRRHVVRKATLPIRTLSRVPRVSRNLFHGGPWGSKSGAARKPSACRAFRKGKCRALCHLRPVTSQADTVWHARSRMLESAQCRSTNTNATTVASASASSCCERRRPPLPSVPSAAARPCPARCPGSPRR